MSDAIIVYARNGRYKEHLIDSFEPVVTELEDARRVLFEYPDTIIIEILSQFGKEIIKDPLLYPIPGISYLSLWLHKENLNNIYTINFQNEVNSGEFNPIDSRTRMIHVPRGIICHWVAGNVPLLGFFSLVLAILGKNASILKIHPAVQEYLCLLLQKLEGISVEMSGRRYSGGVIAHAVSLVSFSGKNVPISTAFSLSADCRVIYGSDEAVSAISCLPHQAHTDTIVYGPKYSFAIFDRESISSPAFPSHLEGLARDIILYNQTACSSPHTVFMEKSSVPLHFIAELLEQALSAVPEKRFLPLDEGTAISVINTRARYLLDASRDILLSDDLKWSICLDNTLSLEEPVQGRCVFLKEVEDKDQILPLVTRKIQTIALCMDSSLKRDEYIRELAYRGVDRVMSPGTMHEFSQPWDGMLGAGRMVRWISVRN